MGNDADAENCAAGLAEAVHLRHQRRHRRTAPGSGGGAGVEAERVGIQARGRDDPGADRADREFSPARRLAPQDPEHRPVVVARHPRSADDRHVRHGRAGAAGEPEADHGDRAAGRRRRAFPQRLAGRGGAEGSAAARSLACRLSRRSPDALGLQRRPADARRDHRGRDRARLRVLRRHRSFVRAADRRRGLDGGSGAAARRDRQVEQALPPPLQAAEGHRGQHPPGRHRRHDAGGARSAGDRRRGAAFRAALDRCRRPPA